MSGGDHEIVDDSALVRPFLSRVTSYGNAAPSPPDQELVEGAAVRSYAITSGRSRGAVHLEFESMLRATPAGADVAGSLSFERGAIARLCTHEVLSVAELSARLRQPIGVIRVVASDLIVEGVLEAFLPSLGITEDIDLISRLIEGVRAL